MARKGETSSEDIREAVNQISEQMDAGGPNPDDPTRGPGDVYYGRRQELRVGQGKTSEEVNAIEEDLRREGKLFAEDSNTETDVAKGNLPVEGGQLTDEEREARGETVATS